MVVRLLSLDFLTDFKDNRHLNRSRRRRRKESYTINFGINNNTDDRRRDGCTAGGRGIDGGAVINTT